MVKTLSIISAIGCCLLLLSCSKQKTVDLPTSEVTEEVMSTPSWITTDYVTGHFDPAQHEDFVVIPTAYADRPGLYLHKETWSAYQGLYKAAQAAGHSLVIKSATRNFEYQKGIWERKWTGETALSDGSKASDLSSPVDRAKKILLYSSMPGTSRHHWGTDIDINSFDNSYFAQGVGGNLYDWMLANAADYGFCQPYTDKSSGRTGYEEERWHWTYTPLSKQLTTFSATQLKDEMIRGFQGSETATQVSMVKDYILGINKACL